MKYFLVCLSVCLFYSKMLPFHTFFLFTPEDYAKVAPKSNSFLSFIVSLTLNQDVWMCQR